MSYNPDTKSRFRILKGGKISLVLSVLAISASLVSPANAVFTVINGATTTTAYNGGIGNSLEVTSAGSLAYNSTNSITAAVDLNNADGQGLWINQSIVNNGTISSTLPAPTSGTASAIYIHPSLGAGVGVAMNAGTEITNTGTMSATANNGSAHTINMVGSVWGEVTNSGTMTATAGGDATNIRLFNPNASNTSIALVSGHSISNTGRMTATSTSNYAWGMYVGGAVYGIIENSSSGIITANGPLGADAINIQNGTGVAIGIAGGITNAGILNATTATGTARGINISGSTSDAIVNSGTINATATNGLARGIDVLGAVHDQVINDGTINVEATGQAFGILLGGADGLGSVTNNGTINVNSDTESYGFKTSKGILGGVTNNGTIKATINNEYDKEGYALYMRFNEAFTNEASGRMYGNIAAYNNAGNVINKGLISLPYNVNGRDGDGDIGGTANLANFSQDATGTLEIGLLTDGTNTTYSKFKVSNIATFADGSTIGVNVLAASTNVALLADATLADVVSAGNLILSGTLNITDNSALLDFEYVKDGNTIDLTAVQAQTITTTVTTPTTPTTTVTTTPTTTTVTTTATTPTTVVATTPTVEEVDKSKTTDDNLVNVAKALDVIRENNNQHPEMNPLIASLNTLATNEEVAAAVESTIAQTTTASVGVASQISNGIASIVEKRQQVNIGSGLNSGDTMLSSKNVWLKTYGSNGTQDNKDGINGFDMNAYGLAIGMDKEYKKNQSFGVAVFYTQANLDVNNASQESDMDVFTALVYGNVGIIDDKTNFLYQLGYAWQQTDSNRNLFTGQTSSASYTSTTASIDLKVLRDVSISEKLLVQPMVSATYRNFDNPSYNETGAGANSLNVNAFSSDELLLGVGVLAHYKIDEESKFMGNVNVAYDTIGDTTSFTSAFQGASGVTFDTNGIDNGDWQYAVGVGYERTVKEGHNINISYGYEAIGSTFSNNVISARYTYTF